MKQLIKPPKRNTQWVLDIYYTEPSTSITSFAIFSQENFLACNRPFLESLARSFSSVISSLIACSIWSSDSGSTIIPASPAASGKEETFDTITGVPQAIASTTGIPNPSQSDGRINALAFANRYGRAEDGVKSVNIIFSSIAKFFGSLNIASFIHACLPLPLIFPAITNLQFSMVLKARISLRRFFLGWIVHIYIM